MKDAPAAFLIILGAIVIGLTATSLAISPIRALVIDPFTHYFASLQDQYLVYLLAGLGVTFSSIIVAKEKGVT